MSIRGFIFATAAAAVVGSALNAQGLVPLVDSIKQNPKAPYTTDQIYDHMQGGAVSGAIGGAVIGVGVCALLATRRRKQNTPAATL